MTIMMGRNTMEPCVRRSNLKKLRTTECVHPQVKYIARSTRNGHPSSLDLLDAIGVLEE